MGYLLDELGLHARGLLCPLVGEHQLAVGLAQLSEGLATLDAIDEEEDDDEEHDDAYGHETLLRQLCPLLYNLTLLALCIIDSSQQVGINDFLAYQGCVVVVGYLGGNEHGRVDMTCQQVGLVLRNHIATDVLEVGLVTTL